MHSRSVSMKTVALNVAAVLLLASAQGAIAQTADAARPWLDTSRSFEQRAADLVSRMTL